MGGRFRARGVRPCPACHAPTLEAGRCSRCAGRWWRAEELAPLLHGRLPQLRRLVGKGPLTSLNCADCRMALKSIDVHGPVHEGDLFWGLETARPGGTCVVDACARCGGVFAPAGELARAGGESALLVSLERTARESS